MPTATDTEAPAQAGTDLAAAINGCDEETWKRLSAALGVPTRPAAIELCSVNPTAAAKAREILGITGEQGTLLTAGAPESLLTRRKKAPALSSLMYSRPTGARW